MNFVQSEGLGKEPSLRHVNESSAFEIWIGDRILSALEWEDNALTTVNAVSRQNEVKCIFDGAMLSQGRIVVKSESTTRLIDDVYT